MLLAVVLVIIIIDRCRPPCRCSSSYSPEESNNPKSFGCGYFLATSKAAKNQVISSTGAATMTGNSRVIEESEEYPRV